MSIAALAHPVLYTTVNQRCRIVVHGMSNNTTTLCHHQYDPDKQDSLCGIWANENNHTWEQQPCSLQVEPPGDVDCGRCANNPRAA